MSASLAFWILVLLWTVLSWPLARDWRHQGHSSILFLIVVLIGWRVFGPPIHN